ncbi:MAG TPA: potassium channel protein [Euryarchaeota archaeon]|nr:potassium channel protein [Euryarchaeota archaeon]
MATIISSVKGESTLDMSVRDIIATLKDVSELMLDLSLSSIIFRDKDMANEVMKLEVVVDRLLEDLDIKVMLSARSIEDARDMLPFLSIAEMIRSISNSAADIANIVFQGKSNLKEIPKIISEFEGLIAVLKVQKDSYVDGKRLDESLIETRTGLRIIAIRRGDVWIFGPEGDEILRGGDTIVVRGYRKGLNLLRKMCTEKEVQLNEQEA